jgi:hypothetical protein
VAVPIGGAVTLRGDAGEQVRISVVGVQDPQLPPNPGFTPVNGNRWVSFQVNVLNTGTVAFIAEPEKNALVIDARGRWFGYSGPMTAAIRPFARSRIAPAFDTDGVIVFEVPKTANLARLRLTPNPQVATQTADWTLL